MRYASTAIAGGRIPAEKWQRGRMHTPAKGAGPNKGLGGSNPPFSARFRKAWNESSRLFFFLKTSPAICYLKQPRDNNLRAFSRNHIRSPSILNRPLSQMQNLRRTICSQAEISLLRANLRRKKLGKQSFARRYFYHPPSDSRRVPRSFRRTRFSRIGELRP